MKSVNSIENIKNELIKSCVNYDAKAFIPFLMSKNVLTGMPNKTRFYLFFKQMVNCTRKNSKGQLTFKIEHENNNNNNNNQRIYYLNFYDKIHKYSRLSIEVRETKENIYLDTLPF